MTNNPFDELFKMLMQNRVVIFHIDIAANERGVEIGVRKDNENYAALAPAGKEILDKVLNAMMEAGKTCMEGDERCGSAQTLVDKRVPVADDDDFFDRVKVIDDDN